MYNYLRDFASSGFVNIAGGCCGTTPPHIAGSAPLRHATLVCGANERARQPSRARSRASPPVSPAHRESSARARASEGTR
jgi:hypothetical protein